MHSKGQGAREYFRLSGDQLRTAADLFDDDPAGTSPALKNIPHAIPKQIAMVINDVHPACPWHLPGLAGECHEALVLFRNDEETMDRFFSSALNGGSGTLDFVEFFPALAQACLDHVTRSHPPLWEWQGA
ncbi:hypothetical protein ACFXKG_11405 [Streptomyces sp. NPDC059255]|uniref:hypothetical protein n=1 Tax=Streptomyces sp. NPDC059255 TaxID=3346793 RepID=UPI0036A837EA